MSNKREKLMNLIEQDDFKEARRFIRTLHHPKQTELLRRIDIAEEKYQHRTASRRENLDIIEGLIDKGHFEKARRFVQNLNHPKKTELLLKIEDKRQTDTMKAIVIGQKDTIEKEPEHPFDILGKRPLGILGMPISFLMGLRMVEVLRNFKRLERTHMVWVGGFIYALLMGLFLVSTLTLGIRAIYQATTPTEFAMFILTLALLALSPYLMVFTQSRLYNHWYHDFKVQHFK